MAKKKNLSSLVKAATKSGGAKKVASLLKKAKESGKISEAKFWGLVKDIKSDVQKAKEAAQKREETPAMAQPTSKQADLFKRAFKSQTDRGVSQEEALKQVQDRATKAGLDISGLGLTVKAPEPTAPEAAAAQADTTTVTEWLPAGTLKVPTVTQKTNIKRIYDRLKTQQGEDVARDAVQRIQERTGIDYITELWLTIKEPETTVTEQVTATEQVEPTEVTEPTEGVTATEQVETVTTNFPSRQDFADDDSYQTAVNQYIEAQKAAGVDIEKIFGESDIEGVNEIMDFASAMKSENMMNALKTRGEIQTYIDELKQVNTEAATEIDSVIGERMKAMNDNFAEITSSIRELENRANNLFDQEKMIARQQRAQQLADAGILTSEQAAGAAALELADYTANVELKRADIMKQAQEMMVNALKEKNTLMDNILQQKWLNVETKQKLAAQVNQMYQNLTNAHQERVQQVNNQFDTAITNAQNQQIAIDVERKLPLIKEEVQKELTDQQKENANTNSNYRYDYVLNKFSEIDANLKRLVAAEMRNFQQAGTFMNLPIDEFVSELAKRVMPQYRKEFGLGGTATTTTATATTPAGTEATETTTVETPTAGAEQTTITQTPATPPVAIETPTIPKVGETIWGLWNIGGWVI